MGVIIPANNEDQKCWLRVNDDPLDNIKYGKETMYKAEKYNWKEGQGIMFNDNYLHDAANESDYIRVVLFLDIQRKFPFWFDWFSSLVLLIGYQTKQVKEIAKNAVFRKAKKHYKED